MQAIPWPSILRALLDAGVTQPQVAAACGCGQSTISDLLNGVSKDTRTTVGLTIVRLARERGIAMPAEVLALLGGAGSEEVGHASSGATPPTGMNEPPPAATGQGVQQEPSHAAA